MRIVAIVFALASAAASAAPPTAIPAAMPAPPPPLAIHRAAGAIVLDGDLSDPGWSGAATIDRFYENSPGQGAEPPVRTVARITYDDTALYVAIEASDPHPSQIRAPFVTRDNVLAPDDGVSVFLDTRNDRRSAIELRVSPRGIQGDAIFDDANGNEDFSPDFFFGTAARVNAKGWTAEMRIPFSSLRYGEADPQTWGILIWRNYPREYRYAIHSVPISHDSACLICHAQSLIGLEGLPKSSHLVAAPYVVGTSRAEPVGAVGSPLTRLPLSKEAGADVKWSPSSNHAFDLTLNPDFSQLEADVAQITANQRFALAVPEKRPFFLEGFDLFDTPLPVVYTRSITSPRWGLRGTGKLGRSAYTLLLSDDRGGGTVILPGPLGSDSAPQDFRSRVVIGRVRYDAGASFLGALLTDREVANGDGHNRVAGPDFQWRPNQNDSVTGQLLFSDTLPAAGQVPAGRVGSLRSWAGSADFSHQVATYDAELIFRNVGSGFRADAGFLPQVGYRHYEGNVGLRRSPEQGFFRFVRPYAWGHYETDQGGRTLVRNLFPGIYLEGKRNLALGIALHAAETERVGDRLLSSNFARVSVSLDPGGWLPHLEAALQWGERIDYVNQRVGRGVVARIDARARPTQHLELALHGTEEWLDVAGARLYVARVERLKGTYAFSARAVVRAIVQYTSVTRNPALYADPVGRRSGSFLGSVVCSYQLDWQTQAIVGYGDDRVVTERNDLQRTGRSLFLKISYALQR